MATFFTQIKARFDAAATLVSSPFDTLRMADTPDTTSYPYCYLEPGDESKQSGDFSNNYFEESFSFHAVDRTQELVEAHGDLITPVFLDVETALSVTGLTVIRLDLTARRSVQVQDNLWEEVLEYTAEYQIAR